MLSLIATGIDSGARLVTGGAGARESAERLCTRPTLPADADPDYQVAQEVGRADMLRSLRRPV